MKVRVRAFAALREVLGSEDLEVELAPETTVATLWEQFVDANHRLEPFTDSLNFAVNHNFVSRDQKLHPGDEVAFLPPVSGG